MHRLVFALVCTAANNRAYRLATMPNWHTCDGARRGTWAPAKSTCGVKHLCPPTGSGVRASVRACSGVARRCGRAERAAGHGQFAASRQTWRQSGHAASHRGLINARSGAAPLMRRQSARLQHIHCRRIARLVCRHPAAERHQEARATRTATPVRGPFRGLRVALPTRRRLRRSPGARSVDIPGAGFQPRA